MFIFVSEGTDELDSYMYQTVGHHAIELYAEAMGLPLYRRTIKGTSVDTGRTYTRCEGDEVEDLYQLLKLVKVRCPVALINLKMCVDVQLVVTTLTVFICGFAVYPIFPHRL